MNALEQSQVKAWLPRRNVDSQKGHNGWVLILAGSHNMPGAAVLAARGAMRAGAGKVTVASVSTVLRAVASSLPEAILFELPTGPNGELGMEAASPLRHYAMNVDSALVGPGLGTSQGVKLLLTEVWQNWKLPTIVDADALNCVAQGVHLPAAPCVLTPHEGEMARLLQTSPEEVHFDRMRAAGNAASRFQATVLLKGAGTLAAPPGEVPILNSTGNPGMASAGMGDVLSGVIGTLLAQKLTPVQAALCGAYWHGLAGDIAAAKLGSQGFLAHEVADLLPFARDQILQLNERIGMEGRPFE